MSSLTNSLARTDGAIRELTQRIELYRRIARRSKNPALAEQATQLLPAANAALSELVKYRSRLHLALEVEVFLSPEEGARPASHPQLPRYIR